MNVDSTIFERALLAEKKYDTDDHLFSMSKRAIETKKFVGNDFSEHISHKYASSIDCKERIRYAITKGLLKEMVDVEGNLNIASWLEKYITLGNSTLEWKNVFIRNDLLNKSVPGLEFRNGFQPDAWEDNGFKYTAVYTTSTNRTNSGELYSFALATKLDSEGIHPSYHVDDSEEYIVNGFPSRYFSATIQNEEIRFAVMNGKFYARMNDSTREIGDVNNVLGIFELNSFLQRVVNVFSL